MPRWLLGALVLTLLASAWPTPPAHAHTFLGHKFAVRTVTYYAPPAWKRGADMAARAWNRSGVRIRFVAASKRRARVPIRRDRAAATCMGLAHVGSARRPRRAWVGLGKLTFCNNDYDLAVLIAHEFGHVIGLGHETRRCATMNISTGYLGGINCDPHQSDPDRWLWRCRILEADDIRGAIKLYGGKMTSRGPELCPIYEAVGPPDDLSATYAYDVDSGVGTVSVTLRRPVDAVVPKFLMPGASSRIVPEVGASCPAPHDENEGFGWTVGIGQSQTINLEADLSPGRYCVSAWVRDTIGRKGQAAQAFFDVPVPPDP